MREGRRGRVRRMRERRMRERRMRERRMRERRMRERRREWRVRGAGTEHGEQLVESMGDLTLNIHSNDLDNKGGRRKRERRREGSWREGR